MQLEWNFYKIRKKSLKCIIFHFSASSLSFYFLLLSFGIISDDFMPWLIISLSSHYWFLSAEGFTPAFPIKQTYTHFDYSLIADIIADYFRRFTGQFNIVGNALANNNDDIMQAVIISSIHTFSITERNEKASISL